MIKLLIPTTPSDTHSIYVKLALEKLGHHVDLWYTADFPIQQTHSFELKNDKFSWRMKSRSLKLNDAKYDLVWYRRPSKPTIPEYLHPDDFENAKKENFTFYQNFWQVIASDAKWINPVHSTYKVNSKVLQLKVAAKIGMNIPRTLISNDPSDIKKFIEKHEGNVVYKTLYPMAWVKDDYVRLTYASLIGMDDLSSDKLLQATPGIFQEKINKKYELRVTYFGDKYIATKINSQIHKEAIMDWRNAPTHELALEVTSLPEKIDELCQKLMRSFGVVFGCFDLIVTPEDEYYFLEVNEQGQFLWIEEVNPDIKMLNQFVAFIVSYDREVTPAFNFSLQEFQEDMLIFKNFSESNHLKTNIY